MITAMPYQTSLLIGMCLGGLGRCVCEDIHTFTNKTEAESTLVDLHDLHSLPTGLARSVFFLM